MMFFSRKKPEKKPAIKKTQPQQTIVQDRVLTEEGWLRRNPTKTSISETTPHKK